MKKYSVFLVAIVLAVCLGFALNGCDNKKKANEITVACNMPLTGPVGIYGERIQNGLELARKDLKLEMEKENIHFVFDYQDNKGETKDAITIYNKQRLNAPDIYMSGITSQTMAIIDQVDKSDMTHFLWSWTPLYLDEGDHNFRCWVNFGVEAEHYINYISKINPQKIAYLYVDNIGSKIQCKDVVLPALNQQNAYTEGYPASTANFKNIIIKVKQMNPDVIVVSGYKDHVINIIKDIDTYNIDRSKVICSMDLLEAIGEMPDEFFEGLHVTAPSFNIPELQSELTKDWINKFKAENKRFPVYTEAYGYDCMLTLFEAAKIAKAKQITLEQALFEVDIEGVTGRLKYGRNGEIENNMHIGVFRNGVIVIE
jgi:ABC-type branched-subunit amino acid transport system substrate-binding protein